MLLKAAVLVLGFLAPTLAWSQTEVHVGLTSVQPPLVINPADKEGLIYDVLDLLNEQQSEYHFSASLYPAKRLLANHKDANVHIVAYNSETWGWSERGGKGSVHLTDGRDLFVSLQDREMDRGHIKEIGAVRGFHYAFAGFDTVKLSRMENVSLVNDETSVLRIVEHQRVEKGILSETFLNWVSVSQPERYKRLDIDNANPDHTYHRQLVVFPYSPIKLKQVNGLLNELKANGRLQAVYDKYGLKVPLITYEDSKVAM